jgi:hypothetical protein
MWFTPEVRRILAYNKPVDLAKRLEHGRLRLPGAALTQELSLQVFQWLLDGIALGPRA